MNNVELATMVVVDAAIAYVDRGEWDRDTNDALVDAVAAYRTAVYRSKDDRWCPACGELLGDSAPQRCLEWVHHA